MTDTPSIFAPDSLAHVTDRLARLKATTCDCDCSPHLDTMHDLVEDDVPWLIDQLAGIVTSPVAQIASQRARNHERWGDKSIESKSPRYSGWLPTLVEEVGEVAVEIQTWDDEEAVRSELIDVAAVALMWIDAIDRANTADVARNTA